MKIITDSHTFEDIANIIKEDVPLLNHRLDEIASECNRYIKQKKPNFPIRFKQREIIGNRGINYLITFLTKSKEDFGLNGLIFELYAYYRNKHGLNAVYLANFTQKGLKSIFFISHFFDRFIERENLDPNLQRFDVIKLFFEMNHCFNIENQTEAPEDNSRFIVCNSGVCLGYLLNENVAIVKTYISRSLLKGGQVQKDLVGFNEIKSYEKLDDLLGETQSFFPDKWG